MFSNLTRSHGPVMWGTPPHVGVEVTTEPLPGGGVAALWGKNRFQLVPRPFLRDFLWAGPREPLVRVYQGTLNSHGSTMMPGPPIVGVPNPASPGPAGVVQAIWANLTFFGPVLGHF